MKYNVGDHVVYCSGEICLVDGIVNRCFDGINEIEYYKLIPVNTNKSSYYIPCENCETKVRNLLTKEEIYELIDEMPNMSAQWCEDKNKRKVLFHSVLRSDDYHKLIEMMHSIYVQRESQREKGKKLLAADERAMNDAEHMIHQEFAFVLGISENEVEEFIEKRLYK
ncbi:MAG: hypothetical protein IJX24_08290 [Oscillospiraceae bacterium]|nr:hypothetical protein [Oscillospiraceae bacterium]